MLQAIIGLLTPVFEGLGVSAVDVQTYVNQLAGYIYGILFTIVAVIVILIAAHWMAKKGTRHVIRTGAVVAGILVITILANVVCLGPLKANLAPIINGKASVPDETKASSEDIIKKVGDEGIVLAQNDDSLLPLSDTNNINVFGWAATNPIYGGTGSGSSSNEGNTDVLTSLKDAGFNVNQDIIDMYTEYSPNRNLGGNVVSVNYTDWSLPEPPVSNYTDDLIQDAEDFSDTAVIVLARSGGEGQDLPTDMGAVINGTYDNVRDEQANGNENYNYFACSYTNNGDYDDFESGQSYLELSKTEQDMINLVTQHFDNIVLVVNSNNPMELGWVNNYNQIKSVLLVPGTGRTGMEGLGRVMKGTVNPSGRTVETYVYDQKATPAYNNYGNFVYDNVSDLQAEYTEADPAYQGVFSFVNYVEGIYVGYKFYETADVEGMDGFNYDDVVQYPFGHGLSYTNFTQDITDLTDNGDSVTVNVTVTNDGDVAGKDVVELYYTPPYTNGGIEKAAVNLIDFAKTDEIEPGQSQTVSFEVDKEDMASYDSSKIKTENGGYILEQGDYTLSVRSDSHTVLDEESFTVDADIDYSQDGRSSDNTAATNRFEDYSNYGLTYLSRADSFANYAEATAAPTDFSMPDDVRETIDAHSVANFDPSAYDNADDEMPTTEADNGITLRDMMGKDYDDPQWDDLLDELSVDEMAQLVQLGGFSTIEIDSVGKVATMDSDGTSGLNDWYAQIFGTAYPTEVLIAQTWNKDLAAEVGSGIGQEYADCHIYGWYGPAMNLHRTAFNGRNFEYYSEDGVLSGYIASAEINAAAQKGVYAYIKHFVVNDQEINRCTLQQIHLTEQTLRETYMKPFEICIKNFDDSNGPLAVMSSFTFIGDRYCGANSDLLNGVLRDEWGYKGMVLTDWYGSYGYQVTMDSVLNGNDLMLGFGRNARTEIENTDSPTMVKALRQASKNIMYTIVRSGNYTIEEESTGPDRMTTIFIAADVAIGVVCVGLFLIVLLRWRKKQKAA